MLSVFFRVKTSRSSQALRRPLDVSRAFALLSAVMSEQLLKIIFGKHFLNHLVLKQFGTKNL